MPIRRILVVAVAGLCLAAVPGCTKATPADDGGKVATLSSAAPGPSASPAAPDRPVLRPDEGKKEFEQYVDAFFQCLRDEGANLGTGRRPDLGRDAKSKAAARACEHLYPETWMEHEARTNPRYVDLLRETAKCLKSRGHEVTVGGDPVAIMYGDNTSANKAYDDEQACQREAFKDDLKKYAGS